MKKLFLTLLCAAGFMAANAAVEGALPGKFSVGEGRYVVFSKGNMQYQAVNYVWRFAEHQYDFVGGIKEGNVSYAFDKCNNARIDKYYDGWIDLFGWCTAKEPTLNSEESRDYAEFAEWGDNTILNGGILREGWRTLSSDEWHYLLISRPNADNLRSQATVNNVHGYILLPDNWQLPKKLTFMPNANSWSANVYSASQWKQMEKAGAVFLPAAGYRSGQQLGALNANGFYWSSNIYEEKPEDARGIYFGEKKFGPSDHEKRYLGLSVRLVLDVQ